MFFNKRKEKQEAEKRAEQERLKEKAEQERLAAEEWKRTHFKLEDNVYTPKKLSRRLLDELDCCSVDLEPEPTNKYDPNAVKVVYDDKAIGYLFKGKLQDKVNEYFQAKRDVDIQAKVYCTFDPSDPDDEPEDPKKLLEIDVVFKK